MYSISHSLKNILSGYIFMNSTPPLCLRLKGGVFKNILLFVPDLRIRCQTSASGSTVKYTSAYLLSFMNYIMQLCITPYRR